MFTTPFWPAADSYHIHIMDISLPDLLSPAALDLFHQATRLEEATCHIHPVSTRTGSTPIAITHSVLQGDTEAVLAFLQCYSPHHQREDADLLLNRLGKTVDMIEYDQKLKGFTL